MQPFTQLGMPFFIKQLVSVVCDRKWFQGLQLELIFFLNGLSPQ
jgi:hypothetical protein